MAKARKKTARKTKPAPKKKVAAKAVAAPAKKKIAKAAKASKVAKVTKVAKAAPKEAAPREAAPKASVKAAAKAASKPAPKAAPAPAAPAKQKKNSAAKAVAAAAATVSRGEAKAAAAAAAPKRTSQPESVAHKFAVAAAQLVRDDKCTDVVLLDVRNLSQVTDYIVIGTGTSDRQMQSVLDHVEELGKSLGYPAWKTDTDQRSTWLLLDCVDVVVHLFEPNTRAHYDLEMLWGDAPRLTWERPDQMPRDLAGLHS
ncbi:MAG: ribosome silencing factor [Phycisphaerales bacterium]|jgi:ribosome-associated protein